MIAMSSITMYLLVGPLPGADSHYTPKPDRQIEHGAAALTFLETHPKAGTRRSRGRLYRAHHWLFYRGLQRAGVLGPFECIHGREGSWTDPNAPHYGGLQMDDSFQRTYGPRYFALWGTADHWPRWAQLHAAYRAWTTRGFYPWPNTARYCGLI